MGADRLLRLHRARVRAGDAPLLRPRAPLGQRGARRALAAAFLARLGYAADALLSVLLAPACAGCSEPLDHPTRGPVCEACWHASAAGIYDGPLRNIIHAFKYDGRRSLAKPLAALMRDRHAAALAGADAVVPVPLHPSRRRSRGFNQADDLARHIGLPMVRALRRVRPTAAQAELAAAARADNVRAAFESTRAARPLHGKIVVVVDDVTTTGATLNACACALEAAGIREVRTISAARAVLRA